MKVTRERAAILAAVLNDASSPLSRSLRPRGIDDTWNAFATDRISSQPLLERWKRFNRQALLNRAAACDARIVIPGDEEWPVALDALGDAMPWALWVRGQSIARLNESRAVSIVGARSCTAYGEHVARELAHDLAIAGMPVVSGGAYGIDAAAHRGALAAGGFTVAVLASGVDLPYPQGNANLFDQIAERGALISESPPGAHPTRPGFLIRNRLVAGLGYGTVVVEARLRSGTFSTYAHAATLNRIVMAVPGSVSSPESAGAHALIRNGAQLVTDAQDVLALVAPLKAAEETPYAVTEWDSLAVDERNVHEAFPTRLAVTVDEIMRKLAVPLPYPAVAVALQSLAERGIVQELLDGSWRRVRRLRGADA